MIPFLVGLWFLRTLSAIPPSTYYWQLKEYRWDRMREFFLQQGGSQVFFSIFQLLMVVSLLLAILLILIPSQPGAYAEWFPMIVAVLIMAELLENVHLFFMRKWKRPKPTKKALLIMLLTLFIEAFMVYLLYDFFRDELPVQTLAIVLAALVVLDHDVNALAVFIVNFFSDFFKRRLYRKARKKRLQLSQLKVIGITGSYGKTSVKEFLSQILSSQYSVLKTEKNTNTEIGIAQTILKKLTPEHEVFVCEMGAYRMGEIKICCMMARPQIGIFTGLNNQHVALFGSINNTFKAKWELVSSLPAEGVALFNGDSDALRSRIKGLRARPIICSTQDGDALAEDIQVDQKSISFRYHNQVFSSPLVGKFQVINVLLSIIAAEQVGMSLKDIAKAVKKLEAPDKTMELHEFSQGFILDDSYNVNTDGLKAALDHLEYFEGQKKILFFPGILELGKSSPEEHERLGELIAHHVDYAFFTDPHFSDQLVAGAMKGGLTRSHIQTISDQDEMIAELQKLLEKDDQKAVLLFESRGAEKVLASLKSYNTNE